MDFINGQNVSIVLFFVGLMGVITRHSIIKSVISIIVMKTGIILFFISIHFKEGSVPPIGKSFEGPVADPLPHALMITAIVIGVAVTAVALVMANAAYDKYKTSNWHEMMTMRKDGGDE